MKFCFYLELFGINVNGAVVLTICIELCVDKVDTNLWAIFVFTRYQSTPLMAWLHVTAYQTI